jgi:hypothetical protein
MIQIVKGDDRVLPLQLYKDEATFAIDVGATVRAAIVNPAHTTLLMAPVTLDNAAVGADWSASLVVMEITSAQSALISETGNAVIEIEVNDGGKSTFFTHIQVVDGLIV